jgi:hypothetical protein
MGRDYRRSAKVSIENVPVPFSWSEFRLRGTKSNRDAIGAVLRLRTGNQVMTRQVHSAGGYLCQSSKTLHFGLGDRTHIDIIDIQWPSGIKQSLEPPAELNRVIDVTEPVR